MEMKTLLDCLNCVAVTAWDLDLTLEAVRESEEAHEVFDRALRKGNIDEHILDPMALRPIAEKLRCEAGDYRVQASAIRLLALLRLTVFDGVLTGRLTHLAKNNGIICQEALFHAAVTLPLILRRSFGGLGAELFTFDSEVFSDEISRRLALAAQHQSSRHLLSYTHFSCP